MDGTPRTGPMRRPVSVLLALCCVVALGMAGCGGGGGGGSSGGSSSEVIIPDGFDPNPDDTNNGGYVPPTQDDTLPMAHNPEPATLFLFLTGTAGAVVLARKRSRARR